MMDFAGTWTSGTGSMEAAVMMPNSSGGYTGHVFARPPNAPGTYAATGVARTVITTTTPGVPTSYMVVSGWYQKQLEPSREPESNTPANQRRRSVIFCGQQTNAMVIELFHKLERLAERERLERERLVLQLENALLRFEKLLPPPAVTKKLK